MRIAAAPLLDALLLAGNSQGRICDHARVQRRERRYYILTVLRGGYQVEVLREIWFDRSDLRVARFADFLGRKAFYSLMFAWPTGSLRITPPDRVPRPRLQTERRVSARGFESERPAR